MFMHAPGFICSQRRPGRPAAGFSLIEMLVVAAVIGLLITLITSVASSAVYSQRRANTLNTMRVLGQAVEAFANEDPLKLVYDNGDRASFGKYPPYQLQLDSANIGATAPRANSVAAFVEPVLPAAPNNNAPAYANSLSDRLWSDLAPRGSTSAGPKTNWVNFLSDTDLNWEPKARVGDNRALAAYLGAFGGKRTVDLPPGIIKVLNPNPLYVDYYNPRGQGTPSSPPVGTQSNFPDLKQVLGFYDAWGVPLDYCLYVKLDIDRAGFNNSDGQFKGYRVAERRPAFRSLGIDKEVWQLQTNPAGGLRANPKKWIWSEDLPRPYARFTNDPANSQNPGNGVLVTPPTGASAGWSRLVGLGENYGYRPIDD